MNSSPVSIDTVSLLTNDNLCKSLWAFLLQCSRLVNHVFRLLNTSNGLILEMVYFHFLHHSMATGPILTTKLRRLCDSARSTRSHRHIIWIGVTRVCRNEADEICKYSSVIFVRQQNVLANISLINCSAISNSEGIDSDRCKVLRGQRWRQPSSQTEGIVSLSITDSTFIIFLCSAFTALPNNTLTVDLTSQWFHSVCLTGEDDVSLEKEATEQPQENIF